MSHKEQAITQYIKDKHTTDECSSFIEGYESAEKNYQDNIKEWERFSIIILISFSIFIVVVLSLI